MLTEVTSNTATATMMMAILGKYGPGNERSSVWIDDCRQPLPASFAFMLPVAQFISKCR